MKKKILLSVAMAIIFVLTLAFAVSAEEVSVHNGKVDLNAKVTLDSGAEVNLFDGEGNALIWYLDSSNELQSIRADDQRVLYYGTYAFGVGNSTVGSVTANEVSKLEIALESGTISSGKIVVFNIMDDDVLINAGGSSYKDCFVNCVKDIFWASANLEYAYLRLDTVAIQRNTFNSCKKLKYVNVENLTELRAIGGGNAFGGSSALFAGQVLDLTRTKLTSINGNAAFNYMSLTGLKLPSTLTKIDPWNIQGTAIVSFAYPTGVATITGSQFNDCKSLTTIYINNTTTKIDDRAFNNTALEKIFYVGTLEQLNALLDNTGTANNVPFWNVVGENKANLISYADYQKLEDKSGKYVVYNYSYCEAYNDGVHTPVASNACVSICSVCSEKIINHVEEKNISVSIAYTSYQKAGEKTITCNNAGCNYKEVINVPALFNCLGYSTPEKGGDGIVIGFTVNKEAVKSYTEATDKSLEFGVFAVSQNKLGSNDVFGEDGTQIEGAIVAKISNDKYASFDLKITGFVTDAHKNAKIAMGAYVIDSDGKISYLQAGTPEENAKYCFVSYDEVTSSQG